MISEKITVKNIRFGKTPMVFKGWHLHYATDVETEKEVRFSLKEHEKLDPTDDSVHTDLYFKSKEESEKNGKSFLKLKSVKTRPFQWEGKVASNKQGENVRDTYEERLDWEMGEKQRHLSFQGILKCYVDLLVLAKGNHDKFKEYKEIVLQHAKEDSEDVIKDFVDEEGA